MGGTQGTPTNVQDASQAQQVAKPVQFQPIDSADISQASQAETQVDPVGAQAKERTPCKRAMDMDAVRAVGETPLARSTRLGGAGKSAASASDGETDGSGKKRGRKSTLENLRSRI